jgi:hypothetical protein
VEVTLSISKVCNNRNASLWATQRRSCSELPRPNWGAGQSTARVGARAELMTAIRRAKGEEDPSTTVPLPGVLSGTSPNEETKMRTMNVTAAMVLLVSATLATAGEFGTKDEAMAMVKSAVALIKEQGPKAYPEISNRAGKFVDRDIYVVVYGLDGKVLAHGGNAKLVGKDMIDAQDVDGKPFVKERTELARQQSEFWQDYKFVNPTTKKVEPKQMYCQRLDESAVCAGVYRL